MSVVTLQAQDGRRALLAFTGLDALRVWQPFEVGYRLRRAGFRRVRKAKARLSWAQFACGGELARFPPPWDWFFQAEA